MASFDEGIAELEKLRDLLRKSELDLAEERTRRGFIEHNTNEINKKISEAEDEVRAMSAKAAAINDRVRIVNDLARSKENAMK